MQIPVMPLARTNPKVFNGKGKLASPPCSICHDIPPGLRIFPAMLTIFGKPHKNGGFCDGVSRRDFLAIGGSVLGGLTLPNLLRAEAEQVGGSPHKSILNIYLPGGPPHLEMWDNKTEAPHEIRGEFDPIRTNATGHYT